MSRNRTKTALVAGVATVLAGAGAAAANAGAGESETETEITGEALTRAGEAAVSATGGGTVTGTEVGDEESYYEVEVTREDGSQVDVQLDESFAVVDRMSDVEGSEDGDQG